jgi:hypothetical protein
VTAYRDFSLGAEVAEEGTEAGPGVGFTEEKLATEQPASSYFDLQWVPGCDRAQPLALQQVGQGGCGPEVERRDLDWLTEELHELGILEGDEWLAVVPLRRWRRQALAVRDEVGRTVGWIRVGGTWPGSVWRTTTFPPARRVGMRCWLGANFAWVCEE